MEIETLEERFLRPARTDVDGLRECARGYPDGVAFFQSLELPEAFIAGADRRSYQLGPSERDAPPLAERALRNVYVDRPLATSRLPEGKELAVAAAACVEAMVAAEDAARRFVAGLHPGHEGHVVWRLTGWGQDPNVPHPNRYPWIDGLTAAVEHVEAEPPSREFTPAFRYVVQLADQARSVPLLNPLLEVWATGCGLWAVNADTIVLFLPNTDCAPRRVGERRRVAKGRALREQNQRLLRAALNLRDWEVRDALDRGADPNTEYDGMRPLHRVARFAAFYNHRNHQQDTEENRAKAASIVKMLLDAGADPAARYQGNSPLYERVFFADGLSPQAFVDGGIDVDTADANGRTALHRAAELGRVEVIERLIALGATVDLPDALGWTPLHLAIFCKQPAAEKALQDAGADPDVPTARGTSPDGIRKPSRRHFDVVRIDIPRALLDAGEAGLQVLGDWLLERGDLRGEAMILASMGLSERAEALLAATRGRWLGLLANSHPQLERLCQAVPNAMRFEHGFLREALLPSDYRGVADALLASSPLLHTLRSAQMPSITVPNRLRRIEVDDCHDPDLLEALLQASPYLESVTLRGRSLENLRIAHGSLRELRIALPYLRNTHRDFPLAALDTPNLTSLSLELHAAPASFPVERLPASLTSLAVRPASEPVLDALAGSMLVKNLDKLQLLSAWQVLATRLGANPDPFVGVKLHLTLLDANREERRAHLAALSDMLDVTIKGCQYRQPGFFHQN